MSEESDATARKEVTDFGRGRGAYSSWDTTSDEEIDLFLERNHVVHLPEHGELVVTEGTTPNGAAGLFVNGEPFANNRDVFYWQKSVDDAKSLLEGRAEGFRYAVLDLEKRRAVLAFLTDKQAKETQYEAERQERRESATKKFYGDHRTFASLFRTTQNVIDSLLDAEDRAEATKP